MIGANDDATHQLGHLLRCAGAAAIFQHVLETTGTAEPDDWRQIERNDDGAGDGKQLAAQAPENGLNLLRRICPLVIGFQRDNEETGIRLRDTIEEIEPHHRQDIANCWLGFDDVFDFLGDDCVAANRRSIRQLHGGEEIALILVG